MMANAVNNPKVWYELGEGGAPGGEKERLESLVGDYRKSSEEMIELGFNGELLLDLQPVEVVTRALPANDEAAIKLIVDNGLMNMACSLFWAGISVANCSILLQAYKQKWEGNEEGFQQIFDVDGIEGIHKMVCRQREGGRQ